MGAKGRKDGLVKGCMAYMGCGSQGGGGGEWSMHGWMDGWRNGGVEGTCRWNDDE